MGLSHMMEVMPATLLATTPFSQQQPARITLSAVERTVNNIRYKKQSRSSTSKKIRSNVKHKSADTHGRQSRQQHYHDNPMLSDHNRRRLSSLERRGDFRPLGRVSEKQLEMLTRSANEVMEQVWKDAGLESPSSTSIIAPIGSQDELQLPKIAEKQPNDTSSTKSTRSSHSDSRTDSGNDEDAVKQRNKGEVIQRVGGKGYSRVDMVKNLQKHRKSLSASVADQTKNNKTGTKKNERRQHCSTSKVDSVSWGDSEGMVKGKGSMKETLATSSVGIDENAKIKKVRNQEKLPPAKDKRQSEENDVMVRPTRSAYIRLPCVEQPQFDADVDLSTATLEDVILRRLDEENNEDEDDFNSKEDRVHWEGNEGGYSPDTIARSASRPTSSEVDERPTIRSEVETPELSEGALSNDEGAQSPKNKRKTMKHSSAMLKDMNGNLSNKDKTHGDDIAASVMKKLQPPIPQVIWPDNRFMTTNTVFVYGSPSQLAPVIVPAHSLDCPLCNFYQRSSYGAICPPNSPTSFLKKDYGFYPVERFYTEV